MKRRQHRLGSNIPNIVRDLLLPALPLSSQVLAEPDINVMRSDMCRFPPAAPPSPIHLFSVRRSTVHHTQQHFSLSEPDPPSAGIVR
jgi:hypothetical protein